MLLSLVWALVSPSTMGMSSDNTCHMRISTDIFRSVASVYFQNGSTVNIAKIEGTTDYKTTMQAAPHIHATEAASRTDPGVVFADHCDCYQDYEHAPEIVSGMHMYLKPIPALFSQATSVVQYYLKIIQGHLPSWMGGTESQALDVSTQSLADMLRVLKFATETYLGTDISNATVVVPFPVGRGRVDSSLLGTRLDAAASTLDLKLSMPTEAVTEIKWEDLHARHWKRSPYTYFSCHPDDEGYVLGIEFNDAALTATILIPECFDGEMYDWITRVLHSIELGARELFKADDWRDTLVNALRSVTAPPIRGVEIDHVNMLVLLGDSARDERLRHALQDVLGDRYDRLIASARDDGSPARDPQFRGAASAAHSNWHWYHHWTPSREHGCVVPGPHPWFWPMVHDLRCDVREVIRAISEWFRSTAEKNADAELAAEQEHKRLLKELAQYPMLIGAQ
jgi:hypothetical protein